MLSEIIKICFLLLFIYLALSTAYLLVCAIAGRLRRKPIFPDKEYRHSIAIFIPSYKEDRVIIDTARSAAAHEYPADRFRVIVIADQLQPATITMLRAIPVDVVEVPVGTNMKSRSLNIALNRFATSGYNIAMILDADNIMEDGVLEKVNSVFNAGFRAVQCHRTAKNQQTPVALLDAISEEINNHLFRQSQRALSFTSALIGSALAIDYPVMLEIFNFPDILNNPGEDREIEVQLIRRRIKVEYLDDAHVYDEKVASAEVFQKQRVRWIEAQVNHVKRFFAADLKPVHSYADFINKFLQSFLLPRLLYIGLSFLLIIILALQYAFNADFMLPGSRNWLLLIGSYYLTLTLSIPGRFYSIHTIRAIAVIPLMIVSMLKALTKVKLNRKEFIHTEKNFSKPLK